MSDTKQLKALRDAAIAFSKTDVFACCDRAIAALEAAEQPSAEQAQQPATVDVPEAPFLPLQLVPVTDRSVADLIAWGTATRAACVRLARERDAYKRAKAENDDRYMTERDEARRELEAEREKREQAEAELAALKGQEPVAWVDLVDARDGVRWSDQVRRWVRGTPLYAAPVPPPDTITREQHEAALAQARRDGLREALALVERDRKRVRGEAAWEALAIAAEAIRALPDAGGEVKP